MSEETMRGRMHVAALTALAGHGIPTHVQELLVRGSGRGDVLPGALKRMLDAVLAEMREPTEAMLVAGLYDESDTVLGSWQAMIDAATKDTTP